MLGLTAVFSDLANLTGFGTDSYLAFILPLSMLQAASFTGAATGVNLARDIEQGWFDRMLVSPLPRPLLLASIVGSGSLRVLLPAGFTLTVAAIFGVDLGGPGRVLLALALAAGFAAVAASWASTLALHFKTQAAAPLMQASMFMAVLFTPSYAPQHLLTGVIEDIARINPVSKVVEGIRQCFVGDVTWATTWPALLVILGLASGCGLLALREMARTGA